jgi:hypothetical protein
MRLEKASYKAIAYSCMNFHYAKAIPVNPTGFSVFYDTNEFCGVIIFSIGANPNLGLPYNLKQGQVIELTRVALNSKQIITSKCLSLSLSLIKKQLPLVKLIVSFADQNQNHIGIIYQATNWYYTGIGKSTPKYLVNGKWVHQRQFGSLGYSIKQNSIDKKIETKIGLDKYRYIYPLTKELIPLCKSLSKPYPKKQPAELPHKGEGESFQIQGAFDSTIPLKVN